MKINLKNLLYWMPRILCILFALFLVVFSMDIFGQGYTFWQTVVGLFMHNLPTFALLIILYFTWKREWIGGILFTGLGWVFLIGTWDKVHHSAHNLISPPLFIIGILFIINWADRVKRRSEPTEKTTV